MATGDYCSNTGCSHEFDKPSFAEILARKRECPACGAINYVSDDLGTALDEAFAKVAAGTTVPQEMRKTASQVSAENLADTITAIREKLGTNSSRFSGTSANTSAKPRNACAAGQEANTAPKFVGTLIYQIGDVAAIRLTDGTTLPTGLYTVLLTKED